VQVFDDFMVNVSSVRTKASCEAFGNVQELMNDGLLFLLCGQPVIPFRYDLDYIRCWKVKRLLPYPAETMNSSDGAPGFRPSAPDAKHELWDNME
jgi:hypothetical protein